LVGLRELRSLVPTLLNVMVGTAHLRAEDMLRGGNGGCDVWHGGCNKATSVLAKECWNGRITGSTGSQFTADMLRTIAKDGANRYRRLLKKLHSIGCRVWPMKGVLSC
jgi:hypothetical protein